MKIFVPGRICLFGEHSDWAGGYRRINAEIEKGYTLICGTNQGIHADVEPHPTALVLGLSYKADIDDDRESPSFEIIERLRAAGAEVAYCDPYIPTARPGRAHDIGLASVPCTAEEFSRYDVIVVSTAHSVFRDPELFRSARLVIDTRNLLAPLGLGAAGPEVVRA